MKIFEAGLPVELSDAAGQFQEGTVDYPFILTFHVHPVSFECKGERVVVLLPDDHIGHLGPVS